jgi:periplasmic protein TonB
MAETGFLAQKPKSPTGLVLVIVLHGAALTAVALSKMEVVSVDPGRLKTYQIPVEAPPPPEVIPEPKPQKQRQSVIETVPPRVPTPPLADNIVIDLPDIPSLPSDPIIGIDPPVAPEPPVPPAPPVRVEAKMRASSELQPPYPASEQRMGREGTVTIRLLIGADGRVKSAEKVRATSDAFYRATERHALRHWRFEPATLDGRPIESRTTLTVHFRLND